MKRSIFKPKPKGIKKWYKDIQRTIKEKKQGVIIEGIAYTRQDNGETEYLNYELIPVPGQNGLYRVEESAMSEKSYRRKRRAEDIGDNIEKEKYLTEKPVNIRSARRSYITADHSIIEQLRSEMKTQIMEKEDAYIPFTQEEFNEGVRIEGEATKQFKLLLERHRIKARITESGDKIAKAIYESGKKSDPRTLGYIGGLTKRRGHIERVYDLEDPRAEAVNKSIFNGLLEQSKELRNRYEDKQLE